MAKYKARPVMVEAVTIREVKPHRQNIPLGLVLENGSLYEASPEMVARHFPKEGDYLVIQDDGYEYLTPRGGFERKYEPL